MRILLPVVYWGGTRTTDRVKGIWERKGNPFKEKVYYLANYHSGQLELNPERRLREML